MSGLILPARFTSQPQYAAPINFANPISNGLQLLTSNNPFGWASIRTRGLREQLLTDATSGDSTKTISDSKGTRWGAVRGTGFNLSASSGYALLPIYADLNAAFALRGEATFVALVRADAGDPNGHDSAVFLSNGVFGSHYPYVDGNIYIGPFSGSRWIGGVAPPSSIFEPHLLAITHKSGQQQALFNNNVLASASIAETPAVVFSSTLGNNGVIYFAAFWNRVLSRAELRSIYECPWQLFQAPRRLWVGATAAGGGTTITCTVGNAVAAGTTASIDAQRIITATVGNAVAAGTTAVIDAQRIITATVGNAVAAGVSASIDAQRVITATVGNAVAAGVTASIVTGTDVVISCTVGNAVADGVAAQIVTTRDVVISCTVGNAVADGVSALISITGSTIVAVPTMDPNYASHLVHFYRGEGPTIPSKVRAKASWDAAMSKITTQNIK